MQAPLTAPIRVRADAHHGDDRRKAGHGRQQAYDEVRVTRLSLEQLRQPELHSISRRIRQHPCHGQGPDQGMPDDRPERCRGSGDCRRLLLQGFGQPLPLAWLEPLGVRRMVREIAIRHQAERHGRQRFQQEQPAPSRYTAESAEAEQRAGHGAADDHGDRDRGHELGDRAGPLAGGKPVRQVHQHARKEARFRDAEQHPEEVERRDAVNHRHGAGHDTPRDHQAADPAPGPEPYQEQVRRHLAQDVTEKEQAGAEAVGGGAEPEILVHAQRGEADVDPVQVVHDVQQEHEGNEAATDLPERRAVGDRGGAGVRARRSCIRGCGHWGSGMKMRPRVGAVEGWAGEAAGRESS